MDKNKLVAWLAVGLVGVGLAAAIWWFFWRVPPFPVGLVQANGRFEGDHYTVSGKWPGRVVDLFVREGDMISHGQRMLQLEAAQLQAKVQQAHAALAARQAGLNAAQTALAVFKQNVPIHIATATAGVQHSVALVQASLATERQAFKDAERFRELWQRQTVERRRSEQADVSWQVALAQHRVAEAARIQAQKQLAEAELGTQQVQAKVDEVAAKVAQVHEAEAVLAEAESICQDLLINAPASGIITTRMVDNGEMVAAGSPLFDIVDLDKLYLKVYVAEQDIGKVRLGLPAQIYTDAYPEQPFAATLRYIAAQAEFTPKEVQTPDERVKLVYAVKLYLNSNPEHKLTPGLPADAVIRWQEASPWSKPRW